MCDKGRRTKGRMPQCRMDKRSKVEKGQKEKKYVKKFNTIILEIIIYNKQIQFFK